MIQLNKILSDDKKRSLIFYEPKERGRKTRERSGIVMVFQLIVIFPCPYSIKWGHIIVLIFLSVDYVFFVKKKRTLFTPWSQEDYESSQQWYNTPGCLLRGLRCTLLSGRCRSWSWHIHYPAGRAADVTESGDFNRIPRHGQQRIGIRECIRCRLACVCESLVTFPLIVTRTSCI